MDWKYHMPHVWRTPRVEWEDVWLMPAKPGYTGPSVWLTVDALGDPTDTTRSPEKAELYEEALRKLGDLDYHIKDADMIVRAKDFSKSELLDWIRICLKAKGFEVDRLIEGTREEFYGTNQQADMIAEITRGLAERDKHPRQ